MANPNVLKRLGLGLTDQDKKEYDLGVTPTATNMPNTADQEEPDEEEAGPTPISPESRYSEALQAAAEAGPTEEDYRQAAIQRSIAQVGAGMPSYLQQMSTTLFHKPDFSGQAAAAKEALRAPDYALSAKERAQKRLEGLAEMARKRALLPGELKKQEAETSMAQMRMDTLKETARLNADKNAPAAPEDIQKFRDKFSKFGAEVPDSIKKGDLSKAWSDASELVVKGGFTVRAAEKAAESREKVAGMKVEAFADTKKRLENKDFSAAVDKTRKEYTEAAKPYETKLSQAENIEKLASSDNWVEFNSVASQMARVIGGEKGVLTDKDVTRYSKDPQLFRSVIDTLSKGITGTPSKETKQQFIEVARDAQEIARKKLAEVQEQHRTQLKNNRIFVSADGKDEDINTQVFGGKVYSLPSTEQAPTTSTSAAPAAKPITALKNNVEHTKMLKPDGSAVYVPSTQVQDFIDKRQYKLSPK